MVEEIEYLSAEFKTSLLAEMDSLVENQIKLAEVWPAKSIARNIAKLAGQRSGERSRVK